MTIKYDSNGHPYEDLTDEHKKLASRVKELENSLSIALDINDNFQREKKKLQDEIDKLKKDIELEKEDHQYDNLVHEKELKRMAKR